MCGTCLLKIANNPSGGILGEKNIHLVLVRLNMYDPLFSATFALVIAILFFWWLYK